MAEQNIQIKDLSGNLLFPKTKGAVVINNAGDNLGGVEAGAQVNIIESITVDGVAVSVTNKTAAITLPTAAEYTVTKKATANTGYLATYELKKDGVAVGDAINIPKDFLVKSASLEICETADDPIEGLEPGDPYLDFVVNTKGDAEAETDTHIYINVADLVDVYTEGNGINIASNVISVDTTDTTIADTAPTANSTKFVQSGGVKTALDGKVDANNAITGATKCKITYDAKGLVTGGADLEATDIPSLALAKISDVTATATEVNQLHEAGAVKADFEKLAAVTASAAELNVLDGITASTAELNILDGVTATTAELNYVDGVTSNIQDQLDGKQATITGAATSIVSNDLTASMILASDASGKVAATSIPAATAFLTYEVLA